LGLFSEEYGYKSFEIQVSVEEGFRKVLYSVFGIAKKFLGKVSFFWFVSFGQAKEMNRNYNCLID